MQVRFHMYMNKTWYYRACAGTTCSQEQGVMSIFLQYASRLSENFGTDESSFTAYLPRSKSPPTKLPYTGADRASGCSYRQRSARCMASMLKKGNYASKQKLPASRNNQLSESAVARNDEYTVRSSVSEPSRQPIQSLTKCQISKNQKDRHAPNGPKLSAYGAFSDENRRKRLYKDGHFVNVYE